MPVLRRVGLFGVVPLVVIAVAAFGWYRLSDTGRDWRYRDRLAGFCQGLVPEAESAAFTGHDQSLLGRDRSVPEHDGLRWERCELGARPNCRCRWAAVGRASPTFRTPRWSCPAPTGTRPWWCPRSGTRRRGRTRRAGPPGSSPPRRCGPPAATGARPSPAARSRRFRGRPATRSPRTSGGPAPVSRSRPRWTGARSTGSSGTWGAGTHPSRTASSARRWPSVRTRTTSRRTTARTPNGWSPPSTTRATAATGTATPLKTLGAARPSQTGYLTPVSLSEHSQRRRCPSTSREAALDLARTG